MNQTRRRTFIFCSLIATFWLEAHFCLQILPSYILYLGGTLTMVGLGSGVFGVTQMLLRIPIGIWSDRIGRRKPFILAAFLVGMAANLMFLGATRPETLVWARAMSGVSTTMWVIVSIFLAELYPQDRITRTMGLINGLTHMAILFASTGGGYAVEFWGWRAPFIGGLIASILGVVPVLLAGKEQGRPAQNPFWPELCRVFRQPLVLLASFLGILLQYGIWTLTSFAPVIAEQLGAGKGDLGLLALFNLVPCAITSTLIGCLQARIGPRLTMLTAFIFMTVGLSIIPLAGSFFTLCLFLVVFAVGRGIVYPILMCWSIQDVTGEQKGTSMSVFQSSYALGMFLGPYISGVLADQHGLVSSFLVAAGLMAVAAVAGWLTARTREPRADSYTAM